MSLDHALFLGFPQPCLFARIPPALRVEVSRAFGIPIPRLANNLAEISAWNLFSFFPLWCLPWPPREGQPGHPLASRPRLRRFEAGDQQVHEDRSRAVARQTRLLEAPPSLDTRLRRAVTLRRVGDLSCAAWALQPSTPAPPTAATAVTLRELHPPFPSQPTGGVLDQSISLGGGGATHPPRFRPTPLCGGRRRDDSGREPDF